MGWTSNDGTRDQVIARQKHFECVGGNLVDAIKTHREANEDWFLYRVRNADGEVLDTFIAVTVWDGRFHKEMEEAVGPYYYRCPLAWLDLVPEAPNEWAAKWRLQVRAFHAEREKAMVTA